MLHGKRAGKLRDLSGMGCRSVGAILPEREIGILWPLSGRKPMRVLRVLIAMALARAMMGLEGKC
jgi:hypothetical protein